MTTNGCTVCNQWACTCPASVRKPLSVIEEAAHLVGHARASEHGDFADNAETAARILNDLGVRVDLEDIPLVLLALKLARHRAAPTNRDNIVDAIGYLGLYARIIGIDEA